MQANFFNELLAKDLKRESIIYDYFIDDTEATVLDWVELREFLTINTIIKTNILKSITKKSYDFIIKYNSIDESQIEEFKEVFKYKGKTNSGFTNTKFRMMVAEKNNFYNYPNSTDHLRHCFLNNHNFQSYNLDKIASKCENIINVILSFYPDCLPIESKKKYEDLNNNEKLGISCELIGLTGDYNNSQSTQHVTHYVKNVLRKYNLTPLQAREIVLDLQGAHSTDWNKNIIPQIAKYLEDIKIWSNSTPQQTDKKTKLEKIWLATAKISIDELTKKGIEKGIWNDDLKIITRRNSIYGTGKITIACLAIALKDYAVNSNIDYTTIGKAFCEYFGIDIKATTKDPYKAFQTGNSKYIRNIKRAFNII